MALEFTEENFESLALKSDKLVMVDFWAEWCGPCRMVGPLVEELSKEYDGKAIVGKVNVDLHGGIAAQYGVRNIPTIVFLKNGELVDKVVGVNDRENPCYTLFPLGCNFFDYKNYIFILVIENLFSYFNLFYKFKCEEN